MIKLGALRKGSIVVAVVLSGATLAGAGVQDEAGRFSGCVHNQTGVLRVLDATGAGDCRPQEHRITWNERGPRGPEGPAGPPGPPGPPGNLTAIEQLEGLPCNGGAGVVDVTIAASGAIGLGCNPSGPPPPPPPDCGSLGGFEPATTPAYHDYPINGETLDNQYRSYLRREHVASIQEAAALVQRVATRSDTGHGAPIGLGDMSECDGSIPGTSVGQPGHPAGTHTGGTDIDIAYYQTGTPDNHLRSVCETQVNDRDQHHCVAPPDRLDPYRTALFLESLAAGGRLRVVGVDGRIGPVLEAALERLCADGVTDCTPVPLAFEATDQGQGWFFFHHDHMHVSFRPVLR